MKIIRYRNVMRGKFNAVEILVVIRHRLIYQNVTIWMQDLLQEYFGTTTWIPYDYTMRKVVCREAFEKLSKYSVNRSECKEITLR